MRKTSGWLAATMLAGVLCHGNVIPPARANPGLDPNDFAEAAAAAAGKLTPYQKACRDAGVPLPPPFSNPGWGVGKPKARQLPNSLVFDGDKGPNDKTEMYAYQSRNGGTCFALPRSTLPTGRIDLLGVICQSAPDASGKSTTCFWDNIKPGTTGTVGKDDPNRIKDTNIANLDPRQFQDGSELSENCTECHRGDNSFITVPGTVEAWTSSGRDSTDYVPLSAGPGGTPRPGWANPLDNGLGLNDSGDPGCQKCHTIPKLTRGYCQLLLGIINGVYPAGVPGKKAGTLLMPPGHAPLDPTKPADKPYTDDIAKLRAECARLAAATP